MYLFFFRVMVTFLRAADFDVTVSLAVCPAIRITATTMPDGQTALLRLMAWLSPAFPIGSFSYSHGLETAVDCGLVTDAASLQDWLEDLLAQAEALIQREPPIFSDEERRRFLHEN